MVYHRLNILVSFCLLGMLSGCEKVDLRGMVVSYESVCDRFDQSMIWNERNPFTEIVVSGNDYEVFVMADTHVGGVNNLNHFIDRAINSNAVATVGVGDLTTGRVKDYGVFHQVIENSGLDGFFPVVGNHELYFDGWSEYRSVFGSSVYYFTIKTDEASDLFICLDSGSGTFGSKQLEWLRELLENDRPDYRRCIIFTHNNFFRLRKTATTNPLTEELRVLMELFLVYKVDMVITGHDHKKSEIAFGNTIYITVDALLDGYKDAGYLKLFFTDDIFTYRFVNL